MGRMKMRPILCLLTGPAGTGKTSRCIEIFRDRIIADNPVTLKALGDRWSVCRERVRQLEERIVTRLRDHNLLETP